MRGGQAQGVGGHDEVDSDLAIRKALRRRWDWLEHQAAGGEAVRQVTWQDLGDDGRRESSVRRSYSGRYPVELLQNAHDACDDAHTVGSVWFVLSDTALLVANQGVGFEPTRITALTRLGSSSKGRRGSGHHQIGYKGIGFTAAFEITDRPQILSGPAAFYFDRAKARREVIARLGQPERSEPVPARCFPFQLNNDDWATDATQIEQLKSQGAVTIIRLPLRSDELRQRVENDLRSSLPPEVLLFMPAIDLIDIRIGNRNESWARRKSGPKGRGQLVHLVSSISGRHSWVMSQRRLSIPPNETAALDDDLWSGVRKLNAAIAIPWSGAGPLANPAPRNLYAYFPTEDRLGRAVIIHGDFYLDDARRHVEWKNAQAPIALRIADGVATLAAELAESLAEHGPSLLACLAPMGSADGFGEELGRRIDQRLRDARIARPASGGRLRRPRELQRLASKLDLAWERRAIRAIAPLGTILRPGDDIGTAGDLLRALGCQPIAATELATRFDLVRAGLPYDQALTILERWLTTLSDVVQQNCVALLGQRSVIQDTSAKWLRPGDVEERSANAPELPVRLRRPELRQPSTATGRAFVRRLRVARLDHATALDRLLDALDKGAFGTTDSEKEQVLAFVTRLWRDNKGVFGPRSLRLGQTQLPTRTHRGRRRAWRRADATYFSAAWTGRATIDDLYGPLGVAEFLAQAPPASQAARSGIREMFEQFGVSAKPRLVRVTEARPPHYLEWRSEGSVMEASKCLENRHEYSGVRIEGTVVDRLDSLLDRATNHERGLALAHGLLLLDDPYGQDALIRCDNAEHRGHAVSRRAIGYQRWRLETIPWVPVRGDPSGAEVQTPSRAWTDMPRTSEWLTVPRAQLRVEDGRRLRLVRAEQPPPDAIEAALSALSESHLDLAAAPAVVRDSARWLMSRLERALRRDDRQHDDVPPLLAESDGKVGWSRSPVVANIPGLPRLPEVPLLPAGRWINVARAYRLRKASEIVVADIRSGPIRHVEKILPVERRVQLLALLAASDSAYRQTAARIASIREIGVAFLNVRWSVNGIAIDTVESAAYLELRRDSQGRPIAATLYRDARKALDPYPVGRSLADYLGLPDHEDAIVLFLRDPQEMVIQRGISPGEMAEARAVLNRRRRFEPEHYAARPEEPGQSTVESTSPSDAPAAPAPAPVVSVPAPTPKPLLDPAKVIFGQPVKSKYQTAQAATRPGPSAVGKRRAYALEMVAPGSTPTVDVEAERRAIDVVKRYGRDSLGAIEVRDVQADNKGWDLEFHFSDKSWLPVEVKGSFGHGPFVITPNEWSAAQRYVKYLLFQVVDIARPGTAKMRCFRALGERLRPGHVKSMSWMVTGWAELEPEQIPLEIPNQSAGH